MKIRNMRDVMVRMSYGHPSGKHVAIIPSKGETVNLPSDRLFDGRLTKDWNDGKVEIILNDLEKAVIEKALNCCGKKCCKKEKAEKPEKPVEHDQAEASAAAVILGEPKEAKKASKPKKKTAKKATKKPARPEDTERLHQLAKSLGLSTRALTATMEEMGIDAIHHKAVVPKETAKKIREHVLGNKGNPKNAPKVESNAPARPGEKVVKSAHSVPENSMGMPSIPEPSGSGVPSLDDLQIANAKLSLDKGDSDA